MKIVKKLLDHAKQSATNTLKAASKETTQKQQKQLVTWLVTKFLIKLHKLHGVHHRIYQRQLKVKQRYSEKDIYLPDNRETLLMI